MVVNLLIVALLLIVGGLIYIAGPVLHLQGNSLLLLRALLGAIGVAAVGAILFLHRRKSSTESSDSNGSVSDFDALLEDAERKLRASQQAGPRSLNRMPLIYLLGDANAAKTTTILHSGLDPELIAGHVYTSADVVATPLVNIWYASGFAIVEAGQAIRSSAPLLDRLLHRTRPAAYRSAFGKGAPPRAAVVCISMERFLGAEAGASAAAAARTAGAQLREISRKMGTAIPVYVLFTKLDRVPHFAEFVRKLSAEEAAGVLGNTVSAIRASAGVYTEHATEVIGRALDTLFFSLAEFRLELLDRENDAQDAGVVYEFPRELRKLRSALTQFLVELSKPSQLSANPYLRGFYFTGVRPQVVEQVVGAPAAAPEAAPDAGATRMFTLADMQAQPTRPPQVVSRRVPQWTFLSRLFPQVILNDRHALTASKESTPARLFRRILFGAIATAAVMYFVLLLLSYANNSALENRITAAASIAGTGATTSGVPTMQQLRAMDELRGAIVQLESWQQHGAPWPYRWGLYQGNHLVASARQLYFDRFRPLILQSTQNKLISTLNALPAAPDAGTDYTAAYNPLKAYLITTTNPEKSTAEFLSPILIQYWPATPAVGADELQLARAQMDFYADELKRANPYSIPADTAAVAHARDYLSKFGGFDRVYQAMLAAADKTNAPIEFNRLFPGSSEVVVDSHIVPGAFTRGGFSYMQDAIRHPDRYFNGETWVLGGAAAPSLDRASISQQLTTRYTAEYLKEWLAFLNAAHVNGYSSLKDAASKLNILAGPTSPLLALFWTVSHNTAVANPDISHVFQPAQVVVPPESRDRLIGQSNTGYINALLALQGSIAQVAQNPAPPTDPAAAAPIVAAATAADNAARQVANGFTVDLQAHTATIDSTALARLEDPIKSAEGLVRAIGPAAINGGGRIFCGSFDALMRKFPFSATSPAQASVTEVNALLAPETGALWQFYNNSLKTLLVQQGTQYVPAPGAPFQVTSSFLRFFDRAAALSSALYPAGAKSPTLTFSLREVPSKGVQNATLSVDGQRISSANTVQQFTWNAQSAGTAQLTASYLDAKDLPLLQFQGTWSLFALLDKAHAQRTGTGAELGFPLEISGTPITLPDGTPLVVRFDLSGSGAELLTPGAFNGFRCVSQIAHQ